MIGLTSERLYGPNSKKPAQWVRVRVLRVFGMECEPRLGEALVSGQLGLHAAPDASWR